MTATETNSSTAPGASAAGRGALAWILALAYTLLVVYASVQPFTGWRRPSAEILHFLAAPWPRYVTLGDVMINLAAYLPLGILLALALGARRKAAVAVLLAAALATALSVALETVQAFLATRIASKVDVLANGAGGLIGAMAAPLLSPAALPGRRLAAWRDRVFRPGTIADCGLVVVCLWLATHLHPTAQLFGTGNLRQTFGLPALLAHTPQLLISAEAAIVLFNLLAVGLLIAGLAREPQRAVSLIAAVIAAGLAIKAAAGVVLFHAPGLFNWLTPGVAFGLVAGAIALFPLTRASPAACSVLAFICVAAAVAAVNLAPDNPYQTVPGKLVAAGASQLLRFSAIVRALSELWPLLAAAYLAATVVRRSRR